MQEIMRKARAHTGHRRNAALPVVAEVSEGYRVAMKRAIMDTWCAEPFKRAKFEEQGVEIPESLGVKPEVPAYLFFILLLFNKFSSINFLLQQFSRIFKIHCIAFFSLFPSHGHACDLEE
jgi:hypothetical protein